MAKIYNPYSTLQSDVDADLRCSIVHDDDSDLLSLLEGNGFPFEFLVEDIQKLILTNHLRGLVAVTMAFTSKKFYAFMKNLYLFRSFFGYQLSRDLGRYGSSHLLHCCISYKWELDLRYILEGAIWAGNDDLLRHFHSRNAEEDDFVDDFKVTKKKKKRQKKVPTDAEKKNTTLMCYMSLRAEVDSWDISNWLGMRGKRSTYKIMSSVGVKIATSAFCLGAAFGGHLAFFSKSVDMKDYMDNPMNFKSIMLESAKGGHIRDLEWFTVPRNIIFSDLPMLNKPSSTILIDPFEILKRLRSRYNFHSTFKFFEEKKCFNKEETLEKILTEAIDVGAFLTVQYLNSKLDTLMDRESSAVRGSLALRAMQEGFPKMALYFLQRTNPVQDRYEFFEAFFMSRIEDRSQPDVIEDGAAFFIEFEKRYGDSFKEDPRKDLKEAEEPQVGVVAEPRFSELALLVTWHAYSGPCSMPSFFLIVEMALRFQYRIPAKILCGFMRHYPHKEKVVELLKMSVSEADKDGIEDLYRFGSILPPISLALSFLEKVYSFGGKVPSSCFEHLAEHYFRKALTLESLEIFLKWYRSHGWESTPELTHESLKHFETKDFEWLFDQGLQFDARCFPFLLQEEKFDKTVSQEMKLDGASYVRSRLKDLRLRIRSVRNHGIHFNQQTSIDVLEELRNMIGIRSRKNRFREVSTKFFRVYCEEGMPLSSDLFHKADLNDYRSMWDLWIDFKCPFNPRTVFGDDFCNATDHERKQRKAFTRMLGFCQAHNLPDR